jgi:hypothetical protein
VVTTSTVRGFVGLERNTQGLGAGETVAALGLDFEATALGQFTDASPDALRSTHCLRENPGKSCANRFSKKG